MHLSRANSISSVLRGVVALPLVAVLFADLTAEAQPVGGKAAKAAPVPEIKPARVLKFGDNKGISYLAFAGENRLLIGGADGEIKLWDVSRDEALWKGGERSIQTSNGALFAALLQEKRAAGAPPPRPIPGEPPPPTIVAIHDALTGKELRRLEVRLGRVGTMALSPNGKLLAVSVQYEERSIQPQTKQVRTETRYLVELWDAATGKPLRKIPNVSLAATAFASDDRSVIVQPTETKRSQPVPVVGSKGKIMGTTTNTYTVLSPTTHHVLGLDTGKSRCRVIAPLDSQQLLWLQHDSQSSAFSSDGGTLATAIAGEEGRGPLCGNMLFGNPNLLADLQARQERERRMSKVVLTDLKTGGEVGRFAKGMMISALAFTPNANKTLIVSGFDLVPPQPGKQPEMKPLIGLWDCAGRRLTARLTGWDGGTAGLAVSPAGKMLATAAGGDVILWDLPPPK